MKSPVELNNNSEHENQSMVPHVWVGFLYYDIIRQHKIIEFNELVNILLKIDDLPSDIFTNIEEQLEFFGVFTTQIHSETDKMYYLHLRDCTREEIRAMITRHPFKENISWRLQNDEENYTLCFNYLDKCKYYKN
ncbi:MAG: hypothetical protein JJE25_02500 [Bacteroidia bacterium]|nr:hypothetical protein [Bacteroidia bacterium]